jgi:hypothetical protein
MVRAGTIWMPMVIPGQCNQHETDIYFIYTFSFRTHLL